MRILRVRRGFQADHSSSSYLFYAVDRPVSAAGQKVAHRYSSRAEVDDRRARYVKWGESSLASGAFEALLDEHYDVMAEESYGWWTLMIAVPKTPEIKAALAEFADARGDDDQGVEVQEYRKRMAVSVYCHFADDGVEFLQGDYDDTDMHEVIVELLAEVRNELIAGNTSFPSAVAELYNAFDRDEDEEDESGEEASPEGLDDMSKAELLEECGRRGIECKKSWNKAQLRAALTPGPAASRGGRLKKHQPKLSRAARTIVDQLESI